MQFFSCFLLLSTTTISTQAATPTQPNIVFIVIDDLGYSDCSFTNPGTTHDVRTPHIDSLRAGGVVLTNYYVHAVCSPSRATFLTGRYAHHHRIVDWIPPDSAYGLGVDEVTLAQKLKEVNYATAMSGKWHLGFYKQEMTPTFRGFDEFVGFYGGGEDYFSHFESGGYDFRRDPTPRCGAGCSEVNTADQNEHSTEVFSREAVRVITEHDAQANPLFLLLSLADTLLQWRVRTAGNMRSDGEDRWLSFS